MTKTYSIPFNKPFIAGKELFYIAQAVISNTHLSGDGKFTRLCHKTLQSMLKCKKVLLTHSGTAALEMAALLCDIQPGDEIIMPSFTFVSTANAFVLRGGVPVFVDIRPDTLNIDEKKIESAITNKTKAIIPVHYAGVSCEMEEILSISNHYKLLCIEDAAQALMSQYKDQYLGTIGDIGILSFHETKNIISGEGGALLINNDQFIERAEILWEKGTNRKQFFRGEVDKYTWLDIGSSFLPSELTAAFLYAQLEQAEKIIKARQDIFNRYYQLLKPLEEAEFFKLPYIDPKNCTHNGHLFFIITHDLEERTQLINTLRENDIYAAFHYVPLHDSPAGKKFGRTADSMEFTTDISSRLLRLPLYYEMTDADVDRVVDEIFKFYKR